VTPGLRADAVRVVRRGLAAAATAVLLGCVASAQAHAAGSDPVAHLESTVRIPPIYNQGIARAADGWVVSGQFALGRLEPDLTGATLAVPNAIPAVWAARGYNHVGDIDIEGPTLYAPIEQPNYNLGHQLMAEYDAGSLRFLAAREVPQHENSFVAVDRDSGIAYTMDHFDGDALLRYDVRAGWEPIKPLRLSRLLHRVQGASVGGGAIWLSTDDGHNGIYRVDSRTGAVTDVGSAPPIAGEGEGIDAAPDGSSLRVLVTAPDLRSVNINSFDVSRPEPASTKSSSSSSPSDWPPALVYFAIFLFLVAFGALFTIYRRARRTLRR
jgi:hypothetical protein